MLTRIRRAMEIIFLVIVIVLGTRVLAEIVTPWLLVATRSLR